MITKNKRSVFVSFLFVFTLFAIDLVAQEVSDQELSQFANVIQDIQAINQSTQQEMVSIVQESGISVEAFNELIQAQQNPTQETAASEEDKEIFNSISGEIDKIRTGAEQAMREKIAENDFTVARYQELSALVQQDEDLQQKLQQFMQAQ